MMGKLTYEQVSEILNTLTISSNNLKSILNKYNGTDNISIRAKKVTSFCNDLDKYISNLYDAIEMNKEADRLIENLKAKIS